jgi:hypothetical protein
VIPLDNNAWHIFGIGIGQGEIIGTGLVLATIIVLTFRLATRGKRYRRG